MFIFFFFFFFQAEDGIRDFHVTGVQTCALPIFRGRIAAYVARPDWCEGTVNTYYGPQSTHDFMERTTWHAAQHLRQIYWFLEQMGVKADAPLTDADLDGLPFPNEVWS